MYGIQYQYPIWILDMGSMEYGMEYKQNRAGADSSTYMVYVYSILVLDGRAELRALQAPRRLKEEQKNKTKINTNKIPITYLSSDRLKV